MFNRLKKLNVIAGLSLAIFIALSFSSSHPTTGSGGYTGAPGDATCSSSSCHSGSNGNLDGEVTIEGLPATIMTGDTYTITVRVTNPNGVAAEAGFQLLALNGTNGNAGSMSNNSSNTQIKMGGGKNYFGHSPSIVFPASNEVIHTVQWTAPTSVGTNPQIKFYAVANIADGNNARTNDRIVFASQFIPIQGSSDPLVVNITNPVNPTCFNTNNGRATVVATGGSGSYTYQWSSGQTNATANNLPGGMSSVTVSDGSNQVIETVELISPVEIEASVTATSTCQGQNNGTAFATASGGTGNLTYTWSNGSTNTSISNLSSGNYTVTIRDANLCTKTASASVGISPVMTVGGTIVQVSCNGSSNGTINSTVSGGTSPFTYLWSNGQSMSSAINLSPGAYTLTVTDAALCTKTASYTVTQPTALVATVNVTGQVICNGGNSGSASLAITGGSPGYTYTWSNGQTGSGNNAAINNLSAGNYRVTVLDAQSCEKIVDFNITQPTALQVTGTASSVSCQGDTNGNINITSSGGTSPYTYLWSNGQTTQNITNQPAGTYTLTTKDANQCQVTNNFTINTPTILNVEIATISQIACSGASSGSLMASSTGGNGGYTYTWSNGATTSTIDNLPANTYKITVLDTKGCQDTISATLTQPAPINVSLVSSTAATCSGATNGSVTISASNTTAPYTYLWVNGQTGPVISNVSAGSYQVTVTDGNNCTTTKNFVVNNEAPFQITAGNITNVNCFGQSTGSASVSPQPNFTYLWSTGATTTSITQQPAGVVSVIGTDAQGCKSDTLKLEIRQLSPQMFLTGLSSTMPSGGLNNGIIEPVIAGGTQPFTYIWKYNGIAFNQNTRIITGLNDGTYDLTVVDSFGCNFTVQPFVLERISSTQDEEELILEMYPNPVSYTLNVEISSGSDIFIFNQNGRLVNRFVQPNDIHQIDVSSWPNGVYYLKARNKYKNINRRFTILH
jgi:hypothetical protein